MTIYWKQSQKGTALIESADRRVTRPYIPFATYLWKKRRRRRKIKPGTWVISASQLIESLAEAAARKTENLYPRKMMRRGSLKRASLARSRLRGRGRKKDPYERTKKKEMDKPSWRKDTTREGSTDGPRYTSRGAFLAELLREGNWEGNSSHLHRRRHAEWQSKVRKAGSNK